MAVDMIARAMAAATGMSNNGNSNTNTNSIIQISELPSSTSNASNITNGKIVQYIGATNDSRFNPELPTYLHGHFYKSNISGTNIEWDEILVQTNNSAFPSDMFNELFATTEDFCSFFSDMHPELCIEGNCFQGTFNIDDFPSIDNGGELILRVFNRNLFQLDFYSTNTEPHHWYSMYYNDSIQFPWTATHDLSKIDGYNGSKTQVLKNDNGFFKWVDE